MSYLWDGLIGMVRVQTGDEIDDSTFVHLAVCWNVLEIK